VVDDVLRHEQDNPTIGLILCQTNDRVVAEYTLRNVNTPIGVSDTTDSRPADELKSSLPTVEEIESGLKNSHRASIRHQNSTSFRTAYGR
jgi:hypothetical protein